MTVNLADHELTLFDSADYKMCEDFALNYEGDHSDLFIKKVFVKTKGEYTPPARPGSEL